MEKEYNHWNCIITTKYLTLLSEGTEIQLEENDFYLQLFISWLHLSLANPLAETIALHHLRLLVASIYPYQEGIVIPQINSPFFQQQNIFRWAHGYPAKDKICLNLGPCIKVPVKWSLSGCAVHHPQILPLKHMSGGSPGCLCPSHRLKMARVGAATLDHRWKSHDESSKVPTSSVAPPPSISNHAERNDNFFCVCLKVLKSVCHSSLGYTLSSIILVIPIAPVFHFFLCFL